MDFLDPMFFLLDIPFKYLKSMLIQQITSRLETWQMGSLYDHTLSPSIFFFYISKTMSGFETKLLLVAVWTAEHEWNNHSLKSTKAKEKSAQ